MKLLFLLLGLFSFTYVSSQCSNFGVQYPNETQFTYSNSLVTVSTCMYGSEYAVFYVRLGETYMWTTCGDTDFDTQLTLWNESHTSWYAYNDDDCGLQSTISWTATFTGIVHVLVSSYNCLSRNTCMTLQWVCTSCSPDCNWTICLYDSYGDGWNGGEVDIYIDSYFIGYATISDGYGPECYSIPLYEGDSLFVDYVPGSWSYENEWYLFDSETNLVQSSGEDEEIPQDFVINTVCDITLPVEFVSLDFECMPDSVKIIWTTASETNNDYFSVEIGRVKGAGNSNSLNYYIFVHDFFLGYSRIKQVDFDGKFDYSETIYVKCNKKFSGIKVFPNPVGKNEHIFIEGKYETLDLFDCQGKKILINENVISGLNSGIYILVIDSVKIKLIVQ